MTKATKLAQEDGAKISTETFNGLTIHIIQGKAEKIPPSSGPIKVPRTTSPPTLTV